MSNRGESERLFDSFFSRICEVTGDARLDLRLVRREELAVLLDCIRFDFYYQHKAAFDGLVGRPVPDAGAKTDLVRRSKEFLFRTRNYARWMRGAREGLRKREVEFLSIEFHPNNVLDVLPVMRSLEENHSVAFVASRASVGVKLQQMGVSQPIDLESHMVTSPREFVAFQRDVGRWLRVVRAEVGEFDKLFSLLARALRHLLTSAWFVYNSLLIVLAACRPRVVVSTGFHRVDSRVAWHLAREANARTAFVQHGLLEETPLSKDIFVDSALVWGRAFIGKFRADNWHVVGSPKHAALLRRYAESKKEEQSVLIVSTHASGKYVTESIYSELVSLFVRTAGMLPCKNFVVKLYSTESLDKVRAQYASAGLPPNLEFATGDVYPFLGSCSTVVCITSSVAIESLLFKSKLILIDIGYSHLFPFSASVPCVTGFDPHQLSRAIEEYESNLTEDYASLFFEPVQDPVRRSVEVLESMLSGPVKQC